VRNTDGRRLDGRHFTRINRYSPAVPAVAHASGRIAELDYVLCCSSGGRYKKCHTNLLLRNLATLVYGDVTDGFRQGHLNLPASSVTTRNELFEQQKMKFALLNDA
jgi:hypothetical protein